MLLQYANVVDSMGAKNFMASLADGVLIIRFSISPVDTSQQTDEIRIHSGELRSVQIPDCVVYDELSRMIARHCNGITTMRMDIVSKGRTLSYTVTRHAQSNDCVLLLVD